MMTNVFSSFPLFSIYLNCVFLLSESCAVDSDCLGEDQVFEPVHGATVTGTSPAQLLLRLLHVATRGQNEY